MGQRICTLVFILLALIQIACDTPQAAQPAQRPNSIVSLSPAATDLVVAIGLTDRIVGVSAFEADESLKQRLPVAGDYLRVDWERIAQLKPGYLIVQGRADRLPAGLKQRADQLGIQLINVQIDRLGDIEQATRLIGTSVGAAEEADLYIQRRRQRLNELSRTSAPGRVKALLITTENAKGVVGRNNFLNDLLELAGGENVIDADGYVMIDQEKLLTLRPEVVFLLMPNANEATVAEATKSLRSAPDLPAVRNGRVVAITKADALLPASGTVALAETFHQHLLSVMHSATTQSNDRPASP